MEPITPQAMHKLVFTILVHGLPDSQTILAQDVLASALKSPNGQVRELAVVAITELAAPPSKRVELLREAIRDPYARVRRRAMRALGDFGNYALEALPQITRGLRDPDPSVRRDSVGTLGRLGSASQAAVSGMVELLADADMRTRAVAATALKRIGTSAVSALMRGLESANPDLRGRCATLLGQIAPEDARVAEALRVVVGDSDADVRRRAGDALTRTPVPLETPAPRVVPNLEYVVGWKG